MPKRIACPKRTTFVRGLAGFGADHRGTVAVMMGLLLPILIGGLGLGFEISTWYLRTRGMQNAADAAAIAAASALSNPNATCTSSGNFCEEEAKAVALRFGFNDGSNNVTITPSRLTAGTAPCPTGLPGTEDCYRVTITSLVPLYLSQIVGYNGDTSIGGAPEKSLSSAAVAQAKPLLQPICMLGLSPTGTAVRSNGGPNTNFVGCTIMSNSNATCNGSNLQAYMGLAHATNSGCGNFQQSTVPSISDPYAARASNIPTDLSSRCSNTFSQTTKTGSTWSGGTTWGVTTTKSLTGSASISGNTLVCGDLRLAGDVTIDAPNGAVLFIANGGLDLNGHTLRTANGSSVTLVFTDTPGAPTNSCTNSRVCNYIPSDTSGGSTGVLDIQAPNAAATDPMAQAFHGFVIYQAPTVPSVDLTYSGNSPTWDITGGVYLPSTSLTISGVVNKSSNGAVCLMMTAHYITINGTGTLYDQTPNGSGCKAAGLEVPTATLSGRAQLVY